MGKSPAISIQNLTTRLKGDTIHQNLSLNLNEGENICVIGPSGAGKSVLMRTILGLHGKEEGEIRIFGQEPHCSDVLKTQTGVLFQTGALFSSLTVMENIMFPMMEICHIPPEMAWHLASQRLGMVGLPQNAAHKKPSDLSGGMVKRAALARALAIDPKLLFLDEPTAGLDPLAATAFNGLLKELKEQLSLTIFMITHDVESVRTLSDKVAVIIHKAAIVGSVDGVQKHNDPWIADYFKNTTRL